MVYLYKCPNVLLNSQRYLHFTLTQCSPRQHIIKAEPYQVSMTAQSQSENCPGQGRVNLSFFRARAESIWALSGTGQSQSELFTGLGRVNLSSVRARAESIWALSGPCRAESIWALSGTALNQSWALSGTGQSQSEHCPGQGRVNLSLFRARTGSIWALSGPCRAESIWALSMKALPTARI